MAKLLHNQSIIDLCLQHTGSLNGLVDLAIANGVSITEDLVVGSELVVPKNIANNATVLNFYKRKNIVPAIGNTIENQQQLSDFTNEFTNEFR
ncbi:MAG: hypothetical protein LC096_05465 [Bacteroidia bacterium]|nr:hypothetical protein [Bacteroidia bacterium]